MKSSNYITTTNHLYLFSPYFPCCSTYHPCCLIQMRPRISKPWLAASSIQRMRTQCNITNPQREDRPSKVIRRSANYQPAAWDNNFLQSLTSDDFTIGKYGAQREKLINDVKILFSEAMADPLRRLELVDTIERLGLKRHFIAETESAMEIVNKEARDDKRFAEDDLYATALRFRLLRQHGHDIPEDVFKKFMKECQFYPELSEDARGLLSLYEASFLGWEGDRIVDQAKVFSAQHLNCLVAQSPPKLAQKVKNALELPLHWRPPRLEARWSIERYEKEEWMNPKLLKLAKLDFNLSQSVYKEEISRLTELWKDLDLAKQLPYVRDRLLEHYCWSHMMIDEPEHDHAREVVCQITFLITTLDDTYDIYGTVEELKILTDFINRWDACGIDQLPQPMKLCFLATFNITNEIGYKTIKDKSFNSVPYLIKAWAGLCNYYLQEAKWYHEGYKPSLRDYLQEFYVSVGSHLMLFGCYIITTANITKEGADYIANFPSLERYCSLIVRLNNDLATSSDELARGDTMKSLQCYMNDNAASEQDAREYVEGLIHQTWKKMNKEYYLTPCHPEMNLGTFRSASVNLARASHFFYKFKRDGHGNPDDLMKDRIKSLLIDPLPYD